MIKKISAYIDSFKITEIDYENNGFKKTIEAKILTVSKASDSTNAGTILEKYRGMTLDAEKYFQENKPLLEKFINRYSISLENFSPDCIVCFFPSVIINSPSNINLVISYS